MTETTWVKPLIQGCKNAVLRPRPKTWVRERNLQWRSSS